MDESKRAIDEASNRLKQWHVNCMKNALPPNSNTHFEWRGSTLTVSPVFETSGMRLLKDGESSQIIECTKCGFFRIQTEESCYHCGHTGM